MAKIANVALTNTFNTWRTNSNQSFDRLSQFAINNSSLYANTVTANTSFTSKGTTNLGDSTGDLTTITGRTTIGTNLAVTGNTSTNKLVVTNSLTSSGNTALGDGVADITTIIGTASISKNLAVSGNTTSNKITATSLLTASGNTVVTGVLTVASDSSFTSTGALLIPSGTTAQRPSTAAGKFRFNSTTSEFEGYSGAAWASVGGAAITNDTSTASQIFPLMANAVSGTASTIFTSNAKLLYKPSTGEFAASALVANNGLVINKTSVASSYTIANGYNAMSVGPVTINSGIAVTVSSGQRWIVL